MPYILIDYANITMETGPRNYITYTSFFDRAIGKAGDITFTYENCGGNNVVQNNKPKSSINKSPLNLKNKLNKILRSRSKNMKRELKELRKQLNR